MGSGGPRGLQNRSGPITSGWVGSIPTRSRHSLPPRSLRLGTHVGFAGQTPLMVTSRLILAIAVVGALAAFAGAPRTLRAQQADSARAGIGAPPISPRRAFLYSLLLPGAGQAMLDRATAGGMFFLIEAVGLVLVHRSAEDLRIARTFAGDSMPLRYATDPVTGLPARTSTGGLQVAEWSVPRYTDAYVRTRRLHYEDWLAVLVFNHLFAGADAFVAAQLWDLPVRIGVMPAATGARISASFRRR